MNKKDLVSNLWFWLASPYRLGPLKESKIINSSQNLFLI